MGRLILSKEKYFAIQDEIDAAMGEALDANLSWPGMGIDWPTDAHRQRCITALDACVAAAQAARAALMELEEEVEE